MYLQISIDNHILQALMHYIDGHWLSMVIAYKVYWPPGLKNKFIQCTLWDSVSKKVSIILHYVAGLWATWPVVQTPDLYVIGFVIDI